jgi:hypothetical protein
MQVSHAELAMIIGQKEIEIFGLQKLIAALNARVAELEPKKLEPELKAVP